MTCHFLPRSHLYFLETFSILPVKYTLLPPQNEAFNRFKESFIKQFANIEHKRLCTAAAALDISIATAECIPLVAIDNNGACTGSLDVRPNFIPENPDTTAAAAADTPVPAAYVCNVVVAPHKRRSGIGRQLIEAAKRIASDQLAVDYLYAHVESVNDAASELYAKCGFIAMAVHEGGVDGTSVGQRTLLRCELNKLET